MAHLHQFAINRPWVTLLLTLVVVAMAVPGALRLELRTDGHALIPPVRPELALDREIRDAFLTEDVIVVLIRADGIPDVSGTGIFNAGTIRVIQELTDEIIALDGIEPHHVSSLATEYSHRVRSGTLKNRRLLEPLPTTQRELARVRGDVYAIGLYRGTVLSHDGKSAAIFVGVPPEFDRTEAYRSILRIVSRRESGPERIDVIGAPVAEALLGSHILEDLGVPTSLLGVETFADASDETPSLRQIIRRIGLVPVAMLVLVMVFAIGFRSVTAAVLPLIEVGACLAFVFGMMGWLGVPVYLTIAVMPVILTAIGVADEIHIFSHYRRRLREGEDDDRRALECAMDEMRPPVMKTSVTTAIAFLSFGLSDQVPVRAFGLMTSLGIVYCMVFSLTAVPAMLSIIPARWFRGGSTQQHPSGRSVLGAVATLGVRIRWWVLIAVGVAAFPLWRGVAKVEVQDSWINGFAPESGFHEATTFFNEHFLGTHLLLARVTGEGLRFGGTFAREDVQNHAIVLRDPPDVSVEEWIDALVVLRNERVAGPDDGRMRGVGIRAGRVTSADRVGETVVLHIDKKKGRLPFALQARDDDSIAYRIAIQPFMKPPVLEKIQAFERFLGEQDALTVGGVIGTASYARTTNLMAMGLKREERRLPATAEKAEWVWEQYERIRGAERMRQLLSPDHAQALTTIYLKDANFRDVDALITAIREYESEHLRPSGLTIDLAGDVAVSQTLIGAIVQTQLLSLGGSFVGIFLVTAVMGHSWRRGFLCIVPCGLAVAGNFAAMGWFGIPLGVATSMFAGMTLGIGVDFAIHLSERFGAYREETGVDGPSAIAKAVVSTGPAVIIDAVAIAVGFGVLIFSQVPANARLGGLLMLSVLTCLLATLLVLPALLALLYRSQTDRQVDRSTNLRDLV